MGVGQSRAPILRRMRAGVAPALPAQCAALFAATAIAFAAPGPALSAGEPGESAASDEAATAAEARPAEPAAPPETAEMPAAEAPASPVADVQRAEPPPAPSGDGVTGEPSGTDVPEGEIVTAPADPPSPVPAATAQATGADKLVVARAPAPTPRTAAFAAPAPPAAPAAPAAPVAPATAPSAAPGSPGAAPSVAHASPPPSTTCPVLAILGTEGDDVLTGTSGPDFICGLGGNDSIDGGAGDDTIDAGPGDDDVAGGDGDDRIAGADGDDRLAGGDGNDCLAGGAGNDRLDGGPGDDVLDGGSGENELVGGDGSDGGTGPLSDPQPGDSQGVSLHPLTGDCKRLFARGGFIGDASDRIKQGIAKLLGAAVEAEAPTPEPLLVAPLDDPLALEDGYARLRVTCSGALTTSMGEVTLTTFDQRPDVRRRPIGDSTAFECSAADTAPVVKVRVPIADRRLITRLGALVVRATAIVEDLAGPDTVARRVFTLVPQRP